MNKNLRKYYIWKFFSLNVFITPIYVIYLREIGLSYLEISTLHIIRDWTMILLEIPSGILSDHIKRKHVLILSAPCLILGMLLFILYPRFEFIAIGFALWGAAISLVSGTAEAYAYENVENKEEYTNVASNSELIRRVSGIFTKATGPILYSLSQIIPFIGSAVMGVVAFFTSMSLKEDKKKTERKERKYFENSFNQIKSKKVILPIVAYAVSLSILSTMFLFQQNLLVDLGVEPIYLSIIYGLFFGAGSLGSYIARHLNKNFSYEYISGAIALTAMISIIIMVTSSNIILVIGTMVCQSLIHGLLFPTQSIYINQHIENENRSGLLSFQSLVLSIFRSAMTLVVGIIADLKGLQAGLLSVCIFSLLLIIGWVIKYTKTKPVAS